MKGHTNFFPVFCLIIACQFFSQSNGCSCLNASFTYRWGAWIGGSRCVGSCNSGIETRQRYCFVYNAAEKFYNTEICEFRNRSDCGNCRGSWTEWANMGQCSGKCGPGIQNQQRLCYRKNTPGRNIRTRDCYGANGSSEDNRSVRCARLSNCDLNIILEHLSTDPTTTAVKTITTATTPKTTTTETTPKTTTTETTPKTTTTTTTLTTKEHTEKNTKMIETATRLINIIKDQTKDLIPDNESPEGFNIGLGNEANRDSPTMQPNGLDSVTLAAILGSVAIVCVTIVAIAVAIMFLKRHDIKKNASSLPNPTSIVKIGSTRNRRSDVNYDSVPLPMPLPSSTSAYGQVSNPLYETGYANDEPIQGSIKKPHYPENGVSHVFNKDIDPIYFSVDDYNR